MHHPHSNKGITLTHTYASLSHTHRHHSHTHICITLTHTYTHLPYHSQEKVKQGHIATHGDSLQHTATATHCHTLQQTATHCHTLRHTATHCNTLQHTATHCNTQPGSSEAGSLSGPLSTLFPGMFGAGPMNMYI